MKCTNDDKKAFLFSIIFHILCCGLVGVIALTTFHAVPDEPIYDVALVSGGGDAAPEVAAPEPEPEPEIEEEAVKPKEDDIVEKREKPIPKKVQPTQKPAAKPKNTAPGGTGTGKSAGTGSAGKGGGSGAGIGPASDAIQAPAVPPRVTRSRMPSYPGAARNKGITGTAVVRFLVGKSGGVESVVLARSSGDASLDQAALSAAGGFRFKPGLDGYGRPIRCYAYQPFAFRL